MEEKYIGLILALSSSFLIGTSFILTKLGLNNVSEKGGNNDSFSYLKNGIWWLGLLSMLLGEVSNFAAYSFAPAVLVTPLGALSVIIGAVLASIFLKEKLDSTGKVGCALCVLGSIIIVIHAPEEKAISSIDEIVTRALKPGFVMYFLSVLVFSLVMIFHFSPKYGKKHLLIYISVCSFVGSITVIACKGFGIALKLTASGNNQFKHPATYIFAIIVAICIVTQMNYFNKALDTYSTNVVTPIYYVMFTTATLTASFIFFQGFQETSFIESVSLVVGFLIVFSGVFLLNNTQKDKIKYDKLSSHSDNTSCTSLNSPSYELATKSTESDFCLDDMPSLA